jgi:hypothetical protein
MSVSAFAAKPGAPSSMTSTVGYDISYPQCGSALPTGQAFAIVGVNKGLANNSNPCFLEQMAWTRKSVGGTKQPLVALYVNTANPGTSSTSWPTSNDYAGTTVTNPYGTCTGAEDMACAFMYGWQKAYDDANSRNVTNPGSYKWWLDVETGNSWSTSDLASNIADLEGMTDYFKSIGATVGVYSTNAQWNAIVGTKVSPASSLNGLDSWLAGARTVNGAKSNCSNPPLTPTSKVTLTQYVSQNLDHDYSCIQ